MPLSPWNCANGEPAPATLACSATVDIAPADDSVDTNAIVITGSGTIASFGDGPGSPIRKRVTFKPANATTIVLKNTPPALVTLTGADRQINQQSLGEYLCDADGHWTETSFAGTGSASSESALAAALAALQAQLEAQINANTAAITALTTRVSALEVRCTTLEARVTALEFYNQQNPRGSPVVGQFEN